MKTLVLLLLFLLPSIPGVSQVITFPYEENFEWQVKQIDEFMDRFNNADYTPIRQYLKEHYDIEDVGRLELLTSLFNFENQEWNKEDVVQFLKSVTESKDPPYLDFYDKDWYAELDCSGSYKGKNEDFTLVLSLLLNPKTGGSKWVINSVDAAFLPPADTAAMAFAMDGKHTGSRSLNPASFGTDFMALVDALTDTANFKNYLGHDELSLPLLVFFDQLYQRHLVFDQVNHITYHFLQIPGWIFQVEDFPRQTTNSGWLISRLMTATGEEKDEYRKQTLYLNP